MKELIITAGGENIPPVLIENEIKVELPFLSNVMVVGDMRKYLTCLIYVKEDAPGSGKLEKSAKEFLELKGIKAESVEELRNNEKFRKVVMDGLKRTNEKAISRAQHVQDFHLLP